MEVGALVTLPGPRPEPYDPLWDTAGDDDAWVRPDGRDPIDNPQADYAERLTYLAFRNGARRPPLSPERYLMRVGIVVTILFLLAVLDYVLHARGIL